MKPALVGRWNCRQLKAWKLNLKGKIEKLSTSRLVKWVWMIDTDICCILNIVLYPRELFFIRPFGLEKLFTIFLFEKNHNQTEKMSFFSLLLLETPKNWNWKEYYVWMFVVLILEFEKVIEIRYSYLWNESKILFIHVSYF